MSRVELRAPRRTDAPTIDQWLAEALVAVAGGTASADLPQSWLAFLEQMPRGTQSLLIIHDRRPTGLLVLRTDGARPIRLDLLAVESTQRNLGLGTEAVVALEARMGLRPIVAHVPPANGLAIYFWLRAGYRPIYPKQTTFAQDLGTAMRREVDLI